MNTFFKTIEEVRNYITVDKSSRFTTIKPYLIEAHKFIRDILGNDTFNELLTNYQEDAGDEDLDALLPYVQFPLANFGYMLGVHKLMNSIGETGIQRGETQSFTPSNAEEVDRLKKSLASSGYNLLEELIIYIDDNKTKYPDAYAFLFSKRHIVNTADEMNKLIFTDVSNLDFQKIKKIIHITEQNEIKEIMGATLFAAIKAEIAAGDISETNETLLETYFREAVANIAYWKFTDKKHDEYKLAGEKLLEQYKNYEAEQNDTEVVRYENNDDDPFFIAGTY